MIDPIRTAFVVSQSTDGDIFGELFNSIKCPLQNVHSLERQLLKWGGHMMMII